MAYVYSHHKKETHEVFYIGISKSNVNKDRAKDFNKRSKLWKRIVNKYGFYYTIICENISWDQAKKIEIELIKRYGRIDKETGVLCNHTSGGEGCLGFVITDEYRKKLSIANKGKGKRFGSDNHFYGKKHSKETRVKISKSLKSTDKNKGINNHNYGKKLSEYQKENIRKMRTGSKHSEETKKKIKQWGKGRPKSEEWKSKITGDKNGWYGKGHLMLGSNNPNAKKCIFIETGEIFGSLKDGCKEKKLSYNTQRLYLNPNHKRHSNRKFNLK